MTTLRTIQSKVSEAIFEGERDGSAINAINQHILPADGTDSIEQVKIYKSAILGTLTRALGNIYPVAQRLVGEEFFAGMARKYALKVPSRSPDLAHYGDEFARFIGDFEPADSVPYLADVATLEWSWHRAFNAADQAALDTARLAEVAESKTGEIRFRLPESASLIRSDFPIQKIWQVNQPEWQHGQTVNLDEGGCRLIVWRQQYDMRIDELNESEWRLLDGVANGIRLEELTEQANIPDFDVLLPACVQRGWIANFELSESNA
jgi:hypothetical protein